MKDLLLPEQNVVADAAPSRLALKIPNGEWADRPAIVVPRRIQGTLKYRYETITFRQLESDVRQLAAALQAHGLRPGMRIVLLVPFGPDFISLVMALLRAGAIVVLIDPGLGRKYLLECLSEVHPQGFVAVPRAHLARWIFRRRFGDSRLNVVVGRGWPGLNVHHLRRERVETFRGVPLKDHDPAAIIFTSGSTGPPKGVLYTHGNFDAQIEQIRQRFQVPQGGSDLACFPLFGLFNAVMGVCTIIPDLNPTRPATADPRRLYQIIQDLTPEQSFASPAVWNVLGQYCVRNNLRLPSLRRIFSAGAPVAPHILQALRSVVSDECTIDTPYGATEALPVSTISDREILAETADKSRHGAGTCVGHRFPQIQWKVIAITDDPLPNLDTVSVLPRGQIGELIVRGPQVTTEYVTRAESNALHKVPDGELVWHRMGDVGYLDEHDRFWYCGRKSQRVITPEGTLYTNPCESIFEQHPAIFRAALVGPGAPGRQVPVIICEPWTTHFPKNARESRTLRQELADLARRSPLTRMICAERIFLHRSLPVDIRHNAKIGREQLRVWAARKLRLPLT